MGATAYPEKVPAWAATAIQSGTPVYSASRRPVISLPPLVFVEEPSPGSVHGNPEAYWLQFALAQLGDHQGEPDGKPGPAMRQGTGQFLMGVTPEQERALKGRNVREILTSAMRDEFRLELPANVGPAAHLTNFARSLVPAEDPKVL